MVGEQVIHRFREALVTELLEERDGVPALVVGVPKPSPPILDAEAVHLRCSVVAADPLHRVAKRGQQIRKVCVSGGLHFGVLETQCCSLVQNVTTFWPKAKTARKGIP